MKLLIESAMIFFGTLMAAGLVALGAPGAAGSHATAARPAQHAQAPSLGPVLVSTRSFSAPDSASAGK